MDISIADVKESLKAMRHRITDLRDEVEFLEKYIATLEAAQQGFAPDVAYWMCERCGDFWHKDYHVCQTCDSPRR